MKKGEHSSRESIEEMGETVDNNQIKYEEVWEDLIQRLDSKYISREKKERNPGS